MHMLEQSHKKRGWSLSPGLHVALRKDTPGELSLELSLKTLRKSLPGGLCQGEHPRQEEKLDTKRLKV